MTTTAEAFLKAEESRRRLMGCRIKYLGGESEFREKTLPFRPLPLWPKEDVDDNVVEPTPKVLLPFSEQESQSGLRFDVEPAVLRAFVEQTKGIEIPPKLLALASAKSDIGIQDNVSLLPSILVSKPISNEGLSVLHSTGSDYKKDMINENFEEEARRMKLNITKKRNEDLIHRLRNHLDMARSEASAKALADMERRVLHGHRVILRLRARLPDSSSIGSEVKQRRYQRQQIILDRLRMRKALMETSTRLRHRRENLLPRLQHRLSVTKGA